MSDQLDMFTVAADAAPAGAQILVFPLARRRKTIRTVASTLTKRVTEEGKVAYWNRIVTGLRRELRDRGYDEVAEQRQIDLFREQISLELARHQKGREQA